MYYKPNFPSHNHPWVQSLIRILFWLEKGLFYLLNWSGYGVGVVFVEIIHHGCRVLLLGVKSLFKVSALLVTVFTHVYQLELFLSCESLVLIYVHCMPCSLCYAKLLFLFSRNRGTRNTRFHRATMCRRGRQYYCAKKTENVLWSWVWCQWK